MDKKKVIVVGAGFGGMATALRLCARGYHVTLLERNTWLGGRARVFQEQGYTFDAGPTVITAPYLFEELFTLFGKSAKDYLTFKPLEPWYRFQFKDGSYFDYGSDRDLVVQNIRKFAPEDVDGYFKLLAYSEKIFDKAFVALADKPFLTISSMLQQAPALLQLKCYKSVYAAVADYLSNEKLRRIFSMHPLLVGGNPFSATAIYLLILYLERKWGIHFAMGGTGAIVAALGKLLQEAGCEIKYNATVEKINVNKGKVSGVTLADGAILAAPVVIYNGDPAYAYHTMLSEMIPAWKKVHLKTLKYSMGLFVCYFGVKKQYREVMHHTILFGETYQTLLDDIFVKNKFNKDVSLYLHRPTATDASLAPPGCDTFYALAPVPNLKGDVDWNVSGAILREHIFDILEKSILPELRKYLEVNFYVTPNYFKEELLSYYGAGFSIQPLLTQSAYFRFHNQDKYIQGLYFTGAGTHPGAGIPGVLSSAKIIDSLID